MLEFDGVLPVEVRLATSGAVARRKAFASVLVDRPPLVLRPAGWQRYARGTRVDGVPPREIDPLRLSLCVRGISVGHRAQRSCSRTAQSINPRALFAWAKDRNGESVASRAIGG